MGRHYPFSRHQGGIRAMAATTHNFSVIGTPQPRVEDHRHLHAAARFVADIECVGCREVAFLRSPVAHGVLNGIEVPSWVNADCVWTAARIDGVARPIESRLLRKEFNFAPLPLLAGAKVRYVGELLAAVAAASRAEAEDIAEALQANISPLPAVMDAWREFHSPTQPLHEMLASNVVMQFGRTIGDAAC